MSTIKASVVHNTVIMNVIATTLIYGSFMDIVRECLLGKEPEREAHGESEHGHGETEEHEFKKNRCLCFKNCLSSSNEWFRKVLIRDYET
jgi:hypothetical protein